MVGVAVELARGDGLRGHNELSITATATTTTAAATTAAAASASAAAITTTATTLLLLLLLLLLLGFGLIRPRTRGRTGSRTSNMLDDNLGTEPLIVKVGCDEWSEEMAPHTSGYGYV